jgi:diguanylate cyclase (GGDEF)-like protein/PAS domain S-box-containing protein
VAARKAIQDHLDGKTPIHRDEYRLRAKDGNYRWILDQGKIVEYDQQEHPLRMTATHTDITELKQTEDQLRQLSRAVEYSPVSIIITDVNGRIEYVNPKFTALAGYTLDEVRGETPRVLKSNMTPPEVYPNLWQTILSGKEWRGEFLNRKKNGELYWEYSSISAIADSKGNITHFVAVNEDITSRKEAEEKIKRLNAGLEQLAMTDFLTSLYNRRYFMQRGVEEFKRTKRNKQSLALLMMDIDEFKSVNDTYGHEAGDMALQQVAAVLKASLRETDILGRMGGEEFAVLLPNTTLEEAAILAERVRQIIMNASFETVGEALTIFVTICIGVAAYTKGMSSIEDLLRNADEALYDAKHNGRNRVTKYKNLSNEVHGISSDLDDE